MSQKGNYISKWYTDIANKNHYKIHLQIEIDKHEALLKAICPAYAEKIISTIRSKYDPGQGYVSNIATSSNRLLRGDDPETIISELLNN